MKETFCYYLTQRPPMIGTQPEGFICDPEEVVIASHPRRTSYLLQYERKLSAEEINNFELVPKLDKGLIGKEFTIILGRFKGSLKVLNISDCGSLIECVQVWEGQENDPEEWSYRGFVKEFPEVNILG